MKIRHLLFIILTLTGCEKMLFEEDPPNNAVNNFEIFWSDFDKYYAQFGIRNIDWDYMYNEYRPQVSTNSTNQQLYSILSEMVTLINDAHVTLYTPHGNATWQKPYPDSYPSSDLVSQSLNLYPEYVNNAIGYSRIDNHNIGYIQVRTFATKGSVSGETDSRYNAIDKIISEFSDVQGIIIDVRMNTGGNSSNAELVASRFADEKRLCSYSKDKNGVMDGDFSEQRAKYIEPGGNAQFTKPVIVLSSRKTGSAAEDFVLAMQVMPHVTIIGDTTAGGIGNPIHRELPNGWNYRLSTSYTMTPKGQVVDGQGIVPDIPVQTTVADSLSGRDRICEMGIEILEQ